MESLLEEWKSLLDITILCPEQIDQDQQGIDENKARIGALDWVLGLKPDIDTPCLVLCDVSGKVLIRLDNSE